ncbi:helix-turn-helix transcriptional regulator [Leifsonia sp. ZF2019]|uniref:helix-turn-helix domain-containing protein n=1 Tax=Leifsonia sp. ZF2019 TaxID=2781978 RepID=UPI001CC04ACF|nr:helix-turn-helix transcriptional regulator [Leifsonia sp. ZF2019]UAJ80715.1 helix-turn-helix transcriptional regulator [Leifsonia sp. ZF2019]
MNTTRRLNGTALRVLRQTLGISARDLAVRVGIDPSFLSRLEHGARQPSAPVLRRLATGLGVPIEAISYPVAPPSA